MIIDYTNIVLTVAVLGVFIVIVFLRSKSGLLFPIEFMLGALINALTAVKSFVDDRKVSGIILILAMIVLLGMAVVSWQVIAK